MNKPSQYIPLWNKVQKEKYAVVETPYPFRIKKAICKRKQIDSDRGIEIAQNSKLHFRILEQKRNNEATDQVVFRLEITLLEKAKDE